MRAYGLPCGLDVSGGGVSANHHADASVAPSGFDDELVEVVECFLEHLRAAEVERLHGGQRRLLTDVEPNHVLDIGMRQLVVGHSCAEGVDHAECAGAERLEHQLAQWGVQPVGAGAVVDDIDSATVARAWRPEPEPPIVLLELVRLGERNRQLRRDPTMLPVRREELERIAAGHTHG
jgi:hypothetical protein